MAYVTFALVVIAPLLSAVVSIMWGDLRRAGRAAVAGLTVATLSALAMLVAVAAADDGHVSAGGPLDLSFGRIGTLLAVVIMATATVVAGFSQRTLDDDGRAGRYFSLIATLAAGSALVVVPATPVLLLIGWIASGWALIGLVGFEADWAPTKEAQRRIGQTLLVGDLALAAALGITVWKSDGMLTGNAAAAVDQLRDETVGGVSSLHLAMLLVVIAGASRSALVPFHRWLIGTLAAPTPVSALVHAGLVSGAGLLLLRFAVAFVASDVAVIVAFVLGVITVVAASAISLTRSDVKGSLAWSTVSQMAFMVVQCAVGAFSSAVFHIAGHGMYKASLFLGAGDTASSALRATRRPGAVGPLAPTSRWMVAAVVASVAVGAAALAIRPDVGPAGEVLVYTFAWITVAFGVEGWLRRGPLAPIPSVAVAVAGGAAAAFTYVGGLRVVEWFVKPSLVGIPEDTIIGPAVLISVLVALAAMVGLIMATPGSTGQAMRDRVYGQVMTLSESAPIVRTRVSGQPAGFGAAPAGGAVRRAEIRAEVADAGAVIAPQWPLSSFVAVNPLTGLESQGFDEATAIARRWLGARTHLPLDTYRRNYAAGSTSDDYVRAVIQDRFAELAASVATSTVGGDGVGPVDVIMADLLYGPEAETPTAPRTAVQRSGPEAAPVTALIDRVLSSWLRSYVESPPWSPRRSQESFLAMARRLMLSDPRLRGIVSPEGNAWVSSLDDNAAAVIDEAFAVSGIAADAREEEARGHLCRLPGWSGLAKWRNEWAQPDEHRPPLAPIDLVAVRSALEALAIGSGHVAASSNGPIDVRDDASLLDARVEAVARALGDAHRSLIEEVLAQVSADARSSVWLAAEERAIDAQLLTKLDSAHPSGSDQTPFAQLVFCIDVRSEGLRRELEALDDVETLGFAGFFGVPMRIRRLGWDHHEPRCPVLVAPAIAATEQARPDAIGPVAGFLARQRTAAGVNAAHSGAKYGPGAPFALAETVGWLTGPLAAVKTFVPRTATPPATPATRMTLDDDEILLEQRTFFAESVLNTMGLIDDFAPLVVLCGHTSRTVNNPHATALECGACAGASGDDNARAVAALLNSPDVRHGLVDRGITIPDETWFVAALHDTSSDRITFLDTTDAPSVFQPAIDRLVDVCEEAGRRQAGTRSAQLPGPARRVRERGADWAQVRPEWGLARNAAFIVGPRSMTRGLDLEGRAFLHGYNAEDDPTGRVLETIMTAPMVVGHWISAQYYFSTVDPEVFGAGNKLVHNPFGTTGVISADNGDLRVGLPLQSTHVDGKPFHQPVRLLAAIAADPDRIDTIIANNPILQTLTKGQWLRIAARAQPGDRWRHRTPDGAWVDSPVAVSSQPPSTHTSNTLKTEAR